jgi:cbb3-type cytochrome oxidase subunit 3
MNIWALYLAATIYVLLTGYWLLRPLIVWRYRVRKNRRRRERARGYLPVFDDQWEPPR